MRTETELKEAIDLLTKLSEFGLHADEDGKVLDALSWVAGEQGTAFGVVTAHARRLGWLGEELWPQRENGPERGDC